MEDAKSKAVQIFGQQPVVCGKEQYHDELGDCRKCSDLCNPVASMEAECMSECPAYYSDQKLWWLELGLCCLTAVVVLFIIVGITIALYYRCKMKDRSQTPTKTREFAYTAFNPFDSKAVNQRPLRPLLSQSSSSLSSVSICDERQSDSRQEPSTSHPNSNSNLASRPRGKGVIPFGRAKCELLLSELQRQREVLERSEKKVDKINEDLNQSEYHIRSIKSLWGAFTNKFRKAPETPPVASQAPPSNSRLQDSLSEMQKSNNDPNDGEGWDSHPVLRQQDENRELYSQETIEKPKSNTQQQIDNNLDQMGSALGRLKHLGLGMQDEIESSSTIITRLGDKVERVDARTRTTNRELERLNRS